MSTFELRAAHTNDLPRLTELRTEQHAIEAQLDPRLTSSQEPVASWRLAVEPIITRDNTRDAGVTVVLRGGLVLGYVRYSRAAVGDGALIEEMVIDAHYGSGGLGSALLDAAGDWARRNGCDHLIIPNVPRFHAVQQAFWEAKRATVIRETRFLRL